MHSFMIYLHCLLSVVTSSAINPMHVRKFIVSAMTYAIKKGSVAQFKTSHFVHLKLVFTCLCCSFSLFCMLDLSLNYCLLLNLNLIKIFKFKILSFTKIVGMLQIHSILALVKLKIDPKNEFLFF